MASIIGGHTYYLREIARVGDKPKVVSQKYWMWFAATEGLRESGRERNRSYLRPHWWTGKCRINFFDQRTSESQTVVLTGSLWREPGKPGATIALRAG